MEPQNDETQLALELTSSLQPLWLTRGRIQEGLAWFDAVLTDQSAHQADIWRRCGDGRSPIGPPSTRRAASTTTSIRPNKPWRSRAKSTTRRCWPARSPPAARSVSYSADAARPYLAEAIGIAREIGDRSRLTRVLTWQANGAFYAGDPITAHTASQEGLDLAGAISDRFHARSCRWTLGLAQMMKGDLPEAIAQIRAVTADADAAHDVLFRWGSRLALSNALAFRGETNTARAAANASLAAATDLWPYNEGFSYAVLATAAVAAGDVAAAAEQARRPGSG